jgi:hypothetical protein
MSQTQKILATIYGDDLNDNTTGETTNENVRNGVESLRSRMGELYLGTPAPTTINTTGVYEKIAGTTLLSADPPAYEIDMPSDGRLRYSGSAKAYASIRGLVSTQLVSGVNQNLSAAIAKNGTVLARSSAPRLHSGTTDIGRLIVETMSAVVADDYFEIWITNETSTANVTAQKLQLIVETKAIES